MAINGLNSTNSFRRRSEHNCRYNYLNLSFFRYKKSIFQHFQILFLIKTGYIQIDFDIILPMQPSEFTKSMNFGSNSKKKSFFHLKFKFIDEKIFFN